MIWTYLIQGPWVVFLAYWAFAARKTNRTDRKESFGWRYGVVFLELIGFVVLSYDKANIGVLGHTIFPRSYALMITAVVLTWAGVGLAIWARAHLGQYWSGRITIKEDHKLIRTGPYARLRHPIYSGVDLGVVGTALAINRWRCVVGVCVIILGFWIKARREEAMLAGQFGDAFEEHRRHTGFLLPKLWQT
jgi:protein-S-isoprenylcysteine O-methyltransferase Ste14